MSDTEFGPFAIGLYHKNDPDDRIVLGKAETDAIATQVVFSIVSQGVGAYIEAASGAGKLITPADWDALPLEDAERLMRQVQDDRVRIATEDMSARIDLAHALPDIDRAIDAARNPHIKKMLYGARGNITDAMMEQIAPENHASLGVTLEGNINPAEVRRLCQSWGRPFITGFDGATLRDRVTGGVGDIFSRDDDDLHEEVEQVASEAMAEAMEKFAKWLESDSDDDAAPKVAA